MSKASECTARGRFPNDETAECRGYTMCLLGGLTNFTQYKLNCPMGSVYSHIEEQCTNATNYKCYPDFNCTGVGNFAVPESTDCTSYVACIEGLSNVGTARLVGCPSNTLFNATAGVCINSTVFNCPTPEINVNKGVIVVKQPPTREGMPGAASSNTNVSFMMLCSVIVLQSVFKL